MASQDRGSGRINAQLATWQPPPPAPIAPLPQHPDAITPASFMASLAELQQAMTQNTAALAEFQRQQHQVAALAHYQPAPPPVQYQHPPAPVPSYQPAQPIAAWQAPQQWHPPAPPNLNLSPTISPVVNVRVDARSHSAQDNGGGGWFAILLGLFFLVPISAALIGGGR